MYFVLLEDSLNSYYPLWRKIILVFFEWLYNFTFLHTNLIIFRIEVKNVPIKNIFKYLTNFNLIFFLPLKM